jgi:hypothetical protein
MSTVYTELLKPKPLYSILHYNVDPASQSNLLSAKMSGPQPDLSVKVLASSPLTPLPLQDTQILQSPKPSSSNGVMSGSQNLLHPQPLAACLKRPHSPSFSDTDSSSDDYDDDEMTDTEVEGLLRPLLACLTAEELEFWKVKEHACTVDKYKGRCTRLVNADNDSRLLTHWTRTAQAQADFANRILRLDEETFLENIVDNTEVGGLWDEVKTHILTTSKTDKTLRPRARVGFELAAYFTTTLLPTFSASRITRGGSGMKHSGERAL